MGVPAVECSVVESRELGRLFADPDFKPVESFVHINVLRVLIHSLYARIFCPRRVSGRLNSHRRNPTMSSKFEVLFHRPLLWSR